MAMGGPEGDSLPVEPETLREFGWREVRARSEDVAAYLPPLLDELRHEPCVHSWRHRLPSYGVLDAASAVGLLEAENIRRPTLTFAYVATGEAGREVVVAAATISDRVAAGFPYPSFPVLARCYIRPRFRGRGLYRAILRHRFETCIQRWGESLCAIHLGSADPAVWSVAVTQGGFDPPFVHVGDEDLEVADAMYPVKDLLAFAPAYVTRLLTQIAAAGDGPAVHTLREHVVALVDHGLPGAGLEPVRRLSEAAAAQSGFDLLETGSPLEALVALGEAIPVIR